MATPKIAVPKTAPKIAFIGAGNMAKAIIGGLLAEGFNHSQILAAGPRQETLDKVQQEFAIETTTDNNAAAAWADVIVLAVKPQMLKEVTLALRDSLSHQPLVISLAAGITTDSIGVWLDGDLPIVRCMPNTPSQLRAGASGLFANSRVNDEHKSLANAILGAVGIVQWLDDEALLNPVTAVSGSGPAYFFLMMEAMIDAGVELGLSRECATELTLQTALGAAMLAKESEYDVAELRRRVTSPKGTTEQAILSFEQDNIRAVVARAMTACSNRAVELSELLGK
ncbi:pyrroline-5-carboxylate reductase [Cellvibrio sp. BR]|uniref:pyrroline-5-carboxylate reductase n=1 Tax=Cellvibrio sp. BR TaxID=1134474 RepID=UPI0002600FBF|nr:pyrroline-5-carboxylate reductase [Cellvibrio sp. BR]EIK46586.1 pyrroline-5-carboxylate reductase [Cellvibrio sp. BR]